ncbi:unnamed protein product [Caenorhabditis brenneri]
MFDKTEIWKQTGEDMKTYSDEECNRLNIFWANFITALATECAHSQANAGVKLRQQSPIVEPGQRGGNGGEHLKGKAVGFYFTPKLVRFFNKIKKNHPEFEVVFVSRDCEDVARQFGDPKIQEFLAQHEVKTIPSMRMIKPNGDVVVLDARTEIQEK